MRAALVALALTVAASTAASAHSRSETTVPPDGATVEAAPDLRMVFDKPMRITAFALTADDDAVAVDRETGMEPVTEFRAAPAEPLAPGTYRVDWRGLSADGHPMQGSFAFTVAE